MPNRGIPYGAPEETRAIGARWPKCERALTVRGIAECGQGCSPIARKYLVISICYLAVCTLKITRELMRNFSGPRRMPAITPDFHRPGLRPPS